MNKIKNLVRRVKTDAFDKVVTKVDDKIKKRELLSFKAELAREHKSIDDYTDEEIESILTDKREKAIAKIKDKSLVGLAVTLLIGI
jgi:Glu-tRNA(Gln) amidotransferase subunit E-like FAD-binding protein